MVKGGASRYMSSAAVLQSVDPSRIGLSMSTRRVGVRRAAAGVSAVILTRRAGKK